MAGVAQQQVCATRLAESNRECFGGSKRPGVHRRCVLQMDGTDTGFRPKVQCFGSALTIGPCRMCRGMRFGVEEGESEKGGGRVVGMMALSGLEGFR